MAVLGGQLIRRWFDEAFPPASFRGEWMAERHPDRPTVDSRSNCAEPGSPNPSWPIGSELGYVVWTLAVRRLGVDLGVHRLDQLT